jgi:threonyl-tRNA synthetase
MIDVELPDNSILKVKKGTSVYDAAKSIGIGLANDAVVAKINGKMVDLFYRILKDCRLEILTNQSEETLKVLNHSAAHIIATVVKRLYPGSKPTIGPPIEPVGFYYDFYTEKPFSNEDLRTIERESKRIIQKNLKFRRIQLSKEEIRNLYIDNQFKLELLNEINEHKISLYRIGENGYLDLCAGPHIPSTGKVKAIKILNSSSAYWRGDPDREQLQRIYGVAFFKKANLTEHLSKLKEAEKRDHRILGPQLDLFDTAKEYGPGMPLFYPKGTILWEAIENFWRKEHRKAGYDIVKTPHLFRAEVWEKSGHLEYYRENMFPVRVGDEKWYVKPMNCPGHMMIFNRKIHSYKELPIRIAEFGTVYRNELSGTLHGLLRVRGFTQDDSHIFILAEQLENEIINIIEMVDHFYEIFGFQDWIFNLSTRPPKSIGSAKIWEHATRSLKKALKKAGKEFKIKEGEGAFYGPKIDIDVKDALGRMWQLATIQVDFNLPERFNLYYMGEDGKKHEPVVIHRVIFGAVDRFIGILLEHYGGNLPLWLSPIHVRIIPITDRNLSYAKKIKREILKDNIRVDIDFSSERMEYKIREAQLNKIPYMVILGDQEENNQSLTIRSRKGNVRRDINLKEFIQDISRRISNHQ